ncbi:uncharacterized protein isoform X2 [Choristoneura fumiferana]|uniref:uncharacterized protein isoform X2 n=1 Tax=Choristoneura fumiferana TaxID=7141 RepID=UPI003D157BA5
MEMNTTLAAGLGVLMIVLALLIRWKWRSPTKAEESSGPLHLVHRLCPHSNVVQAVQLEQKDSLDDHLDVLTRKLAEKEGRLRLSKFKIRETQNEIENLHAIDHDVRLKYHEIMESLRTDLLNNDKECKRLQEQIEWVSQRRAELKDEVRRGHKIYGEAAAELASNLAELQKGRVEPRVTEKPHNQSERSLRHRKEPLLPRATPIGSLVIKSPPRSLAVSPERSMIEKPK